MSSASGPGSGGPTPSQSPAPQSGHNTTTRANMRQSNNSTKNGDIARKQSPLDPNARRPPAQKAWTGGPNPLTQRATPVSQPNGTAAASKPPNTPKANAQKDGTLSDKHAHDRTLYFLGGAVGCTVIITLKSGERFEGLLAGSNLPSSNAKITTKMTKKASSASSYGVASREAAFVGSSPEHTMSFDVRDLADLHVPDFSIPQTSKMSNGAATRFQTDTDISGNQNRGERRLQKWVAEGPVDKDFSLDGKSSGWDQFAANKQLFGAQSTYDESLYTTSIDRGSESYRQREARAAKLAREIEATQTTNQHVREERGQAPQQDIDDEEAKYSGVRRDEATFPALSSGGANKYTPPARRAPTNLPTVAGAPYDSAIVSAQLSRPGSKPASQGQPRQASPVAPSDVPQGTHDSGKSVEIVAQASEPVQKVKLDEPPSNGADNRIENQVVSSFRRFADEEKAKVMEKKKAQASHERNAKLQDLLQFSKDFKLKTAVPQDLVGILAKDPAKQEAIVQKAQRELDDTPQTTPAKQTPIRKSDIAQIPPFQGGRGRGLPPSASMRLPQQQAPLPIRGPSGSKPAKASQPPSVPAPIPLVDSRVPPSASMTDQSSPSRSTMQTPLSTTSSARLNPNVKAFEFKPTASTFNPNGSSNTPSSPASVARAASISRAASPSTFFGSRKPKPASERPSITASFQIIKKLQRDVADNAAKSKDQKSADSLPIKDYAQNGGIAPPYLTLPRWPVLPQNEEKTYLTAFERPATTSPTVSRAGSAQTLPYHQQGPNTVGSNMGQMPGAPNMNPNYSHGYDEQRMPMMQGPGQVYHSPNFQPRQPSNYASPMGHPAQLSYSQQPYFGGQMPMQMRPYPSTLHGQAGAPMMMQQQSSGPYMGMPPQYNGQMGMYSPSPGHAYPQQNGYGSPGRAPMMMPQGSQQGQPMMWSASAQAGGMYGQQGQMNAYRNYQAPYGSSPQQQPYPGQQQRTMSGGYGQMPQQKMMHMQHAQMGQDEGK